MNPAESNVLHLLHVAALFVLAGYTFYAFAAAPETRKGVLITTGIATLVALLTGIRMWQGLFGFAMMGWIIVKVVCWLGFSALSGLAYRRREKAQLLMSIGAVLLVVAVSMVYLKPF